MALIVSNGQNPFWGSALNFKYHFWFAVILLLKGFLQLLQIQRLLWIKCT